MNRRAMTLIEVAMAVLILSISMTPLMKSFAENARQTISATQDSVASFLVTERMEEIIAARYRSSTGYSNVLQASFSDESPVTNFPAFTRTVTVQEVASDLSTPQTGSGIKRVTVNVSWNSGAKQMQLVRIFADF